MASKPSLQTRYSKYQRQLTAVTAEQQRQADIVATRIEGASSGSLSRDETALLTAKLSQIAVEQVQEASAEEDQDPFERDDPIDEDSPEDVGADNKSTGTLRRAAEAAEKEDTNPEGLSVQEFPAYRRATSVTTSPVRRGRQKITYNDYLAKQDLPPPPPPPRPTRIEKRRQLAYKSRIADIAEKTEAILFLKKKHNPTDEDLIAVVSQLSDFKKKKRLTEKEAKGRARTLRRLERYETIPIPRKRVNLLDVERQVSREVLQGQFRRCVEAENDHALRGRDPGDLPELFFATDYAHGQWIQYDDLTVEWEPHQYCHGYFEGSTGRWIGHLTPDGTRIYLRDGSIGPEYSGSN